MNDNELYHYGVKGMKWGVRRYGLVSRQENKKIGRQTYKETYKVQRDAGKSRKESSAYCSWTGALVPSNVSA